MPPGQQAVGDTFGIDVTDSAYNIDIPNILRNSLPPMKQIARHWLRMQPAL